MICRVKTFIIALMAMVSISGCGLVDESDKIKIRKCEYSAWALERNSDLMASAYGWKYGQLQAPVNRSDAIKQKEKEELALMEARTDSKSKNMSVLIGWYKSDYCVSLLDDYQDYKYGKLAPQEIEILERNKGVEKVLMRQVIYYSKSIANADSKDVSCGDFKDHFKFTYQNRLTGDFRESLSDGLRATIKDAGYRLKKYQRDALAVDVDGDNLQGISAEILNGCIGDNFLSKRLINAEFINQYRSPRLNYLLIKNKEAHEESLKSIRDINTCGQLPDVYCLAEIHAQAITSAIEIATRCDEDDNVEKHCDSTAEEILAQERKRLEIDVLISKRDNLQKYIERSIDGSMQLNPSQMSIANELIEICSKDALSTGITGEAYQNHIRRVCWPNVKLGFMKSEVDVLEKINERLKQLSD